MSFQTRIWNFLKAYWPSLVVGAGIFYLSLLKAPRMHLDLDNPDKFEHMFAYLVWGLCLTSDLWRAGVSFSGRIGWALVFPVAFGGIIEILQYFHPIRSGEWLDFYADFSGAVLAFVLIDVLYRICSPRYLKK